MNCTDELRDKFFEDMFNDYSSDEAKTFIQKTKAKFIKYQKHLVEEDKEYDFDHIATCAKLAVYPKCDGMIERCVNINYGCDECKCIHHIPYLSSSLLVDELNEIYGKSLILPHSTRRGLIGLIRIGIYKGIISDDPFYERVLREESYTYLSLERRKEIFSALNKIAEQCHDPRYLLSCELLKDMRNKIDDIEGYTIFDGKYILWIGGKVESVKDEIKNIYGPDGISEDWFEYSRSASGHCERIDE